MLAHLIMQWLQLQFPMHEPEDLYDVNDIYNATNFAIGGRARDATFGIVPTQAQQTTYQPLQNLTSPMAASTSADPTAVKIEALTAAIANLSEMFKMFLEVQQGSRQTRNTGLQPVSAAGSACNFCGGTGHFIQQCKVVAEYN